MNVISYVNRGLNRRYFRILDVLMANDDVQVVRIDNGHRIVRLRCEGDNVYALANGKYRKVGHHPNFS